MNTHIECVDPWGVKVFVLKSSEHSEMVTRGNRYREVESHRAKRRMFVVGEVEEPGILRSDRRRGIAADGHVTAG